MVDYNDIYLRTTKELKSATDEDIIYVQAKYTLLLKELDDTIATICVQHDAVIDEMLLRNLVEKDPAVTPGPVTRRRKT
jgi:hypothetical protein